VYRLREKVAYHAKALAIKNQTEIVSEWLKISLSEHNLGLTNSQWMDVDRQLTPKQRYILTSLKAGEAIATIAKDLHIKTNQVEGEWKQIYLLAQTIRNGEIAVRSID
jgi:DNA-binding NarL/FixJ family response regulator